MINEDKLKGQNPTLSIIIYNSLLEEDVKAKSTDKEKLINEIEIAKQRLRKTLISIKWSSFRNAQVLLFNNKNNKTNTLDFNQDPGCENVTGNTNADTTGKTIYDLVFERAYDFDNVTVVDIDSKEDLLKEHQKALQMQNPDYVIYIKEGNSFQIDCIRRQLVRIQEKEADVCVSNIVFEDKDNLKINPMYQIQYESWNKDQILKLFFEKRGDAHIWLALDNKLTKHSLVQNALQNIIANGKITCANYYVPLVYNIFANANKACAIKDDACYVDIKDIRKYQRLTIRMENIIPKSDQFFGIIQSIKEFEENSNHKYKEYLDCLLDWQKLYMQNQIANINAANLENYEKQQALKQLISNFANNAIKDEQILEKLKHIKVNLKQEYDQYIQELERIFETSTFANIYSNYNMGLEQAKHRICDAKYNVVSFDIFDTLVLRPFLFPSDVFEIMNTYYNKWMNNKTIFIFSQARQDIERSLRLQNPSEETTLDEIYESLEKNLKIPKDVCAKLKQLEIDLELQYIYPRKTGIKLLELAKHMGKKVIITSDMYLPQDVIERILKKNKIEYDKLYISCTYNASKQLGTIFKVIEKDLKENPKSFLHIGDNYYADYTQAIKNKWDAIHFIKTIDCTMHVKDLSGKINDLLTTNPGGYYKEEYAKWFLGFRTLIAYFTNEYFDNPYRSFDPETFTNADPKVLGKLILGTYVFGVGRWLNAVIKKGGYENVQFIARDGYLQKRSYELFRKYDSTLPKANYLYNSRKALIPLELENIQTMYQMNLIMNIDALTPIKLVKNLSTMMENFDEKEFEKQVKEKGIDPSTPIKEYKNLLKVVDIFLEKYYSKEKHQNTNKNIIQYLNDNITNNTIFFDVGYSLRPEVVFANTTAKDNIGTAFLFADKYGRYYSNQNNIPLETYFAKKPLYTGYLMETIISSTAPSCVGFKNVDGKIQPIFEKNMLDRKTKNIIDLSHNLALEFLEQVLETYKDHMFIFNDTPYSYYSTPLLQYLFTPIKKDLSFFKDVLFADEVGMEKRDISYDDELIMILEKIKKAKAGKNIILNKEDILNAKGNIVQVYNDKPIKIELEKSIIDQVKLADDKQITKEQIYEELLSKKSAFKKAVFYLENDPEKFKQMFSNKFKSFTSFFGKKKNKKD